MTTPAPHQHESGVTPSTEPAPSPAVAPPPGNPRFPLFDSLRAFAVLAVIVFHVTSITGAVNDGFAGDVFAVLGNQGLVLFFVISGFLLYRPYALAHAAGRPRPSTRRFARRRALRILPAYWTALTVLAIFPGIVGVFTGDWWRYYFFAQDYSNRTLGGGIPPAWTLGVEVVFYVSLPLWALLVRWLHARVTPRAWLISELAPLGVVMVFGALVQLAASRLVVSSLLATTILGESIWFALGMAIALASVVTAHRSKAPAAVRLVAARPGWCWMGALACLIAVALVLHPGGLFGIIVSLRTKQPFTRTLASILLTGGVVTLLVAPAVFGEHAGGWPRRVLAWAPLAWLGLVSYGVYLYHLTIAELLAETADPAHFSARGLGLASSTPLLFVLTFAGSVAAAALSYYLVELRFLRRKEG